MENINNDIRMSSNEPNLVILEPAPFAITFTWKDEYRTVQLKNGEDIFKLEEAFRNLLFMNNIPYEVTK
jgi:hypothetical protein